VGIFKDWMKAAEEKRRQAEEEERLIREYDEERKRERKELWSTLGSALASGLNEIGGQLTEHIGTLQAEEDKLQRILKDPNGLDGLSDVELEHLRITTESDIAYYESDSKKLISPGTAPGVMDVVVYENLHNRRLLLRLIEANQQRRNKPQPKEPATAAERRRQLSADIQDLMEEKAEMIKQMRQRNADEDEIMQFENMYDDAIRKKQFQLRKILVQ